MILVDSSAWIEFLRRTESPVDVYLASLVSAGAHIALTDAVSLELLSGVRSEGDARELQRFMSSFEHVRTHAPGDFEEAALISRICRRAGETPRSRLDCLIAAVALRNQAEVLHRDRDFDLIGRHVPLRIHAHAG